MTPAQCRSGREAASLTVPVLARRSGVMATAVRRYEGGGLLPVASQDRIQTALEAAGVEFGAGAGVRMRKAEP